MDITSAAKIESPEPLIHRLDELDRRVSRLEQVGPPDANHAPPEWTESESVKAVLPPTHIDGEGIGHIFGSVAIAILGLAGGYLLRAVQTGWLPRSSGIISAFLYALMWFVAGGFTKCGQAASAIYALASSIIFVGAVLENAVGPTLLAPSMAAVLIVLYLGIGHLVAWIRHRGLIATVTVASSVALSLFLFLTTHNLIPFDISLLCAAAASEFAASRGRWLGQRWMAALGVDFAVFVTAWIFSSGTLPEGYAPFGGNIPCRSNMKHVT